MCLMGWRTWNWSGISTWVVRGCSKALNWALKMEFMRATNEPPQSCKW
jgi:hypothetical protein